jgi:hypothetical protein
METGPTALGSEGCLRKNAAVRAMRRSLYDGVASRTDDWPGNPHAFLVGCGGYVVKVCLQPADNL